METDRRKFLKSIAGFSTLAASAVPGVSLASTSSARIQDIRLSKNKGYVRLVFDLDGIADHSVFALHKPERVVLDIKNVKMPHGMVDRVQAGVNGSALIRGIRSGVRNKNDLRVVLDLRESAKPRSFLLTPSGKSGYRLVIDLHDSKKTVEKSARVKKSRKRDVIVAIDAGHGGRDPGAIGRSGTYEKTITLQIAKRLQKQINQQRGMKAVLIRKNDRFMRLRERIQKARDYNADMMISLHANSFHDPRARGSSIFALSVDGASSERARMLAKKENAADVLFGNVNVDIEDKMVRDVLFDLSLTGTIESSLDIGNEIIKQVKTVNRVHKKQVQQAGFAVLKAPNIPSVLFETAFISNPREEKKLRSSSHQQKLAQAITRGVSKYFARKAPPGTWLAASEGEVFVNNGDDIKTIAKNNNVKEEDLRARNALYADNLMAGQVMKIPVS
ncbi:N-acetylmuramoyl-L-alanine amidase [Cardiobacterium sp. AH-315-I02]|nr:N-acetylmuramoyl-L-alanine amidase [Cardiobacterium sp. AH-315-I02]